MKLALLGLDRFTLALAAAAKDDPRQEVVAIYDATPAQRSLLVDIVDPRAVRDTWEDLLHEPVAEMVIVAPLDEPADELRERRADQLRKLVQSGMALAIVVIFQDPALFRYNTQLASLAGLIAISLAVMYFAGRSLKVISIIGMIAIAGVRNTPMLAGTSGRSRVRSGLMTSQLCPPLVVLNSTFPAKYSVCGSVGANRTGAVRRKRYRPERIASGAMFWTWPVRRSKRVILPPYTMSGFSGSGAT